MITKEILILLIPMITMNMQNKLYTIHFSHHLMTDSQSVPEQQSWNIKLVNFAKFPKKTELQGKFDLPDKRGFELMETSRAGRFLPPGQLSFIN